MLPSSISMMSTSSAHLYDIIVGLWLLVIEILDAFRRVEILLLKISETVSLSQHDAIEQCSNQCDRGIYPDSSVDLERTIYQVFMGHYHYEQIYVFSQ